MSAVIVIQIARQRRSIALRGPTLIGRDENCTLRIESRRVSRRHALIDNDGGDWSIRDLESRNGTWVNDMRLEGPHPLRHRDRVWIGDARLVFTEVLAVYPSLAPTRRDSRPEGDILFRCGACRQKVSAPFYMVSAGTRCPRCRARLIVPVPPEEPPPSHFVEVGEDRPETPADAPQAPGTIDAAPFRGGAGAGASGVADRAGAPSHRRPWVGAPGGAPGERVHDRPAARADACAMPGGVPAVGPLASMVSDRPYTAVPVDTDAPADWAGVPSGIGYDHLAPPATDAPPLAIVTGPAPVPLAPVHPAAEVGAAMALAGADAVVSTSPDDQLAAVPRDALGPGVGLCPVVAPRLLAAGDRLATGDRPSPQPMLGPPKALGGDSAVTAQVGSGVSGSGLFDLIHPHRSSPPPGTVGKPRPPGVPAPTSPDPDRELKIFEALRDRAGGYWVSLAAGRSASHGRTRAILARAKALGGVGTDELRGQLAGLHHAFRQGRQQRADVDLAMALACEALRRTAPPPLQATRVAAALAMEVGCIAVLPGDCRLGIALAAALAGLRRRGCHVLLPDHAAAVAQAEGFRPFYRLCGLTVACLDPAASVALRRSAFAADVTYLTAAAAMGDYQRQQARPPRRAPAAAPARLSAHGTGEGRVAPVMRGLEFAIVTDIAGTLHAEVPGETDASALADAANPPAPAGPLRVSAFLRRYRRLRGTTAGDAGVRRELWRTYQVPVVPIITRGSE